MAAANEKKYSITLAHDGKAGFILDDSIRYRGCDGILQWGREMGSTPSIAWVTRNL